ncbi:hypothetical protein LTR36_009663 [Oleoguttula mirabilis]|uniref:Uncharacterized protein n=1 Tax=Oleoguttula mirabilis TaxID=1507867 RepID=A0AAV9J654_9PEZI|nr:hypothetical protein LTR36_009663 [Oleoguttula mirabilis]
MTWLSSPFPCPRARPTPPSVHANHASGPNIPYEEPTLSALLFVAIAVAIIFLSTGLAILIVRVMRRKEARDAAFESEVPPPYEDGQPPAYSDNDGEAIAELEGHAPGTECKC